MGWSCQSNPKIVPLGNFRVKGKQVKPANDGHFLLVCGVMPRYSFDIRSMAISSQMTSYFDDLYDFFGALPPHLQNKTLVRTFYAKDYGWSQIPRWLERYPNVKIDDGEQPLWDVARNCSLFIATYNATTFLESFSHNFPTVMFWNPLMWEIKPEAQIYFEELKRVGVFHEGFLSAAAHISNISGNIFNWWNSDAVQKARLNFCNAYSLESTEVIFELKKILVNELSVEDHSRDLLN